MKLYYILSVSALLLASCGENNSQKNEENTPTEVAIPAENLQELSLTVEGMTCQAGCANTIKKHLEKTEGVFSAKVDKESKSAVIQYDKTKLSEADLVSVIEHVGDGDTYKVVK
ncbi:MAG: heavy metal-associated domain-containing protein [Capnocytophaga sp.]|nr:heavy metal-associated domain-containing protein [Capnocytophaga sp.]